MILTALFLTSVFVTATALCSRSSFQLGLIMSNPDSLKDGYARTAINLVGQAIFVLGLQLAFLFWIVSAANTGVLFALAVIYWVLTTIIVVALCVLGCFTGRKNVEATKRDISTFVPGGGYAPVVNLAITWKNQAGLGYRAYHFINAITLPSILFCVAIGLGWGFITK